MIKPGWSNDYALSAEGQKLATAGLSGLKLWETQTGTMLQEFNTSEQFDVIDLSANGLMLFAGNLFGGSLWNVKTRERTSISKKMVTAATFSKDGQLLLFGSKNSAELWDVKNIKQNQFFTGQAGIETHTIAGSSNGRYLLTAHTGGIAWLWDMEGETEPKLLRTEGYIESAAFAPDDRTLLLAINHEKVAIYDAGSGEFLKYIPHPGESKSEWTISYFGDVNEISHNRRFLIKDDFSSHRCWIWDISNQQIISELEGPSGKIKNASFSQSDKYVITSSEDDTARIYEVRNGKKIRKYGNKLWINWVGFYDDETALIMDGNGTLYSLNIQTGKICKKVEDMLVVSSNGRYAAGYLPVVYDVDNGQRLLRKRSDFYYNRSMLSNDGRWLFSLHSGGATLWDIRKNQKKWSYITSGNAKPMFLNGCYAERYIIFISDFSIDVLNFENGKKMYSLLPTTEGDWLIVLPNGRFDANSLDYNSSINWILPSDPLKPLPMEIFMRDYYEPRLLRRVLAGEAFKPIRPLNDLNHVQPEVKILKVEKVTSSDQVSVTVDVSRAERIFHRDGKDMLIMTGVHDLRLFRDGQLVGQFPEPKEETYKSIDVTSPEELQSWRKATEIKLEKDGKATKTFMVRLPRRKDLKDVEFTAYAFNEDRVKSITARQKYTLPEQLNSVKGRAYIIAVGVSGNEDLHWRLTAAAEDAKLIQKAVSDNIKKLANYEIEKVVPIPLITVPPVSDFEDAEMKKERETFISPTKENIRTIVDILAGRKVDPSLLEQIPPELRNDIRPVQPEDLVILSFSSHGVTDVNGEFYILPYDLGEGSGGKITPELLKHSIASQELSLWLSPLDAEQMFMVIDACHSAAAVDVEGFKPGPMGNPGLGQLSYDKKMSILTATQATNSAWAKGYSLLTYALAKEGIEENRAAQNGQLMLSDALKYAEARVPKLYEEMMGKEGTGQLPKLFEFKR
jgi:WD40 repeat protein